MQEIPSPFGGQADLNKFLAEQAPVNHAFGTLFHDVLGRLRRRELSGAQFYAQLTEDRRKASIFLNPTRGSFAAEGYLTMTLDRTPDGRLLLGYCEGLYAEITVNPNGDLDLQEIQGGAFQYGGEDGELEWSQYSPESAWIDMGDEMALLNTDGLLREAFMDGLLSAVPLEDQPAE